jgi:hypothetical protein
MSANFDCVRIMTVIKMNLDDFRNSVFTFGKRLANRFTLLNPRKASTAGPRVSVHCGVRNDVSGQPPVTRPDDTDALGRINSGPDIEWSQGGFLENRYANQHDDHGSDPGAHVSRESLETLISTGILYPEEIKTAERIINGMRRQDERSGRSSLCASMDR